LNNLQSPPQATTNVTLYANLNSEDPVIGGGFDATDPTNTSNYFTSARVFDSQGVDHVATVYFTKTADNSWDYNVLVADAEIVGSNPLVNGDFELAASGTLDFNQFGALQTATELTNEFDFVGGVAQDQTISFNFGDAIDDAGTGLGGSAQYSNPSLVTFMSQDGYTSGSLRGIAIDSTGKITGVFSNGKTRDVSQVALATFQNDGGLIKTAGNTWVKSPTSGEPTIQPPGAGAAGLIISSTLELSNVDLANEFVQLIANQRALQASSRVLTTSDDMLQEVVNLKR
jgi:flagellar hook protein FlgE